MLSCSPAPPADTGFTFERVVESGAGTHGMTATATSIRDFHDLIDLIARVATRRRRPRLAGGGASGDAGGVRAPTDGSRAADGAPGRANLPRVQLEPPHDRRRHPLAALTRPSASSSVRF